MILSPPILALVVGSSLTCLLIVGAAGAGLTVVVGWNPEKPGARQLARERRALLVESTLGLAFGWQLLLLVLFVVVAERIHPLLEGAMCAAGSLRANPFGVPTLGLATFAFLLCGLWLLVHRAAPVAASPGLVRCKHLSLIPLAVLLVAENVFQLRYFLDLDPTVVTSCCTTIFGAAAEAPGGGLASLPVGATRTATFGVLAGTLAAGWWSVHRRRSPALYALLSLVSGSVGLGALIVWVAPAVLELPTHHCPFCLLSTAHGVVGHGLVLALTIGVLAGAGSGLLHGLRRLDPYGSIRPGVEWRLCRASMAGFVLFALLSLQPSAELGLRALRAAGS